jgi:hypothetical protein
MPYTCNDCTTASTGLQSIPIFASFPRTKRVLRPPASSVIPSLHGVKVPLSCVHCDRIPRASVEDTRSIRAEECITLSHQSGLPNTLSVRFPAWTGAKSDAAIHQNLQLPSTTIRFWRGFLRWHIASAHDWGQLLTLRVKTCSIFGSFTTS